MSTIFIETIPIGNGEFEFTQTLTQAGQNIAERVWIENHSDRMYAAMTNLGHACKWIADDKIDRGAVCIVSDRDGLDKKFGGEHDELYEAIHSKDDFQKNRLSYSIFYGKYVAFLDRIRYLADSNEITFTQNLETLKLCNSETPQPFNTDPDSLHLIVNQNWTRENILKLSLKGDKNIATCRACQASITIQQTENFMASTVKHWDTKRLMKIGNPKQLLEHFLNTHLHLHGKLKTKKNKSRQRLQLR